MLLFQEVDLDAFSSSPLWRPVYPPWYVITVTFSPILPPTLPPSSSCLSVVLRKDLKEASKCYFIEKEVRRASHSCHPCQMVSAHGLVWDGGIAPQKTEKG